MARQPDPVDGIRLDVTTQPGYDETAANDDPQVGDVYRSRSGQAAYWWIIGIVHGDYHHTAFYLTFNHRGDMVGQGRVGMHCLRERPKAGHCPVPTLEVTWY